RRFGFELTFFREGVSRDESKTNAWDAKDVYFAHLVLSDLDGGEFLRAERMNRAGPGIAGANAENRRIWNGNWEVKWIGDEQELRAVDERFALRLGMRATKARVEHGENGVSQKAEGTGRASHYTSLTRSETSGEIELQGKKFAVRGLAWMDHEFFTQQLGKEQVGWDWMSLQMADDTELMLFR